MITINELNKRLKGCYNVLFNKHSFVGTPDNNCPCYDKYGNMIGFWSRSTAVVVFAFVEDNGEWFVLTSQRGSGTPDPEFVGAYNCICGYLDCNETREQAARREVREETGVYIDESVSLKMWRENDNPSDDKRQNLTYCYYCVLPEKKWYYEAMFSHKMNEKDEVMEIKFINVKEIDKYKWAFKHDELIKKAVECVPGYPNTID